MSKIQVNNLENTENVKLTPTGIGVVEVKGAGGADGTLALTSSSSNQVKIKSPPHSAQQSYTMVLPDNTISASDLLKVKTVTGASGNQEGFLEFASVAAPDLTNLSANNLTSGTVPASSFPSTFTAQQTALELHSTLTVTSPVNTIRHAIDEGLYWIIGKNLVSDGNSTVPEIIWDRYSNTNSSMYQRQTTFRGGNESNTATASNDMKLEHNASNDRQAVFVAWLGNVDRRPWMYWRATRPGYESGFEAYCWSSETYRIGALRFYCGGLPFQPPTKILFYKFKES